MTLPEPYFETELGKLYCGDVRSVLSELPDESVQCCITSPPYWGLRDYGIEPQIWDERSLCCNHVWGDELISQQNDSNRGTMQWTTGGNPAAKVKSEKSSQGQFCQNCGAWRGSLGLEPTPELYIKHIVEIFREIRRVLRDDGTFWLNLGDSYAGGGRAGKGEYKNKHINMGKHQHMSTYTDPSPIPNGLKPKDLIGIPWRVAMALQADGWYLRSAMPWVKRSAMPESCNDRPSSALEHLFLLSKSQQYYFDMEAIKLQSSPDSHRRYARGRSNEHKWASGGPGNQTIAKSMKHMIKGVTPKSAPAGSGIKANESFHAAVGDLVESRNFRNTDLFYQSINPPHGMIFCDDEMVGIDVNPKGFKEAHFATFPPKLIEPCIFAGTKESDTILEPFSGAGTTPWLCEKYNRKWIAADLSEEYCEMAKKRIIKERQQLKLF